MASLGPLTNKFESDWQKSNAGAASRELWPGRAVTIYVVVSTVVTLLSETWLRFTIDQSGWRAEVLRVVLAFSLPGPLIAYLLSAYKGAVEDWAAGNSFVLLGSLRARECRGRRAPSGRLRRRVSASADAAGILQNQPDALL